MWTELEKSAHSQGIGLALVVGEVVQIAFLDALYQDMKSQDITFQGGTSIRLLYGGWRYSEDLDFVTMALDSPHFEDVIKDAFQRTLHTLELLLGPSTFTLTLKPKPKRGAVKPYWLILARAGEARFYRVKLEFAHFPVYRPQAVAVKRPLLVLPIVPLVMAESPSELLADKMTAFAGRPYLKGRDLFDLWYLVETLHVELDLSLLRQKFLDYHVTHPNASLVHRLAELRFSHLKDEMDRFLPQSYRSRLVQNRSSPILDSVRKTVGRVIEEMSA